MKKLLPFVGLTVLSIHALAQGTAFTYQGRLNDGANPANGTYDLRFQLNDAATGGNQWGQALTNSAVTVSNGLFTTTLDFGFGVLTGGPRWLQIGIRTNGGASFQSLTPRTAVLPTPYAVYAAGAAQAGTISGTVPASGLNGLYSNPVNFNNPASSFAGDGTGLLNVNAATLNGIGSAGFWKTNGNTGANPTNGAFLGTTDNMPLEFRVNGARALRLEPTAYTTEVNVIGGSVGNQVTGGAYGATIWGGGFDDTNNHGNVVSGNFGTVSGGRQNSANNAETTVAGGRANAANGLNSTVSGGYANIVGGAYGSIGGGIFNTLANSDYAAISGGYLNAILTNSPYGVIAGGGNNTILSNAPRATVSGGVANTVGAQEATVSGGAFNKALGFSSTVGGGGGNQVSGQWATIAGGRDNLATNADYATIPGGQQNSATANYAFAAGRRAKANHAGAFVWADSVDADFASIANNQFLIRAAGGVGINTANPGGAALAVNGAVSATYFTGDGSFLSGVPSLSSGNQFTGDQSISGNLTVSQSIAIGSAATAGFSAAAIGFDAQAGGNYSTAIGEHTRANADYGMALGFGSQANHTGSFVWADATFTGFASTGINQFLIRAGGGVGINTTSPGGAALAVNGLTTSTTARINGANNWGVSGGEGDFRVGNDSYRFKIGVANGGGGAGDVWMRAHGGIERVNLKAPGGTRILSNEAETAGVSLAAGGTAWAVISDRHVKKDFAAVDGVHILEKLAAMPITQWHYQWETADAPPHIGPMAQDFKGAFYPGSDDKSITTQEADGVMMAAIQGLNQKVQQKETEITELKQRLEKLEQLLAPKLAGGGK